MLSCNNRADGNKNDDDANANDKYKFKIVAYSITGTVRREDTANAMLSVDGWII